MTKDFELADVDETLWELIETRFSDLAEDLGHINLSILGKIENRAVAIVQIARDIERHSVKMMSRTAVVKKPWKRKSIDTDTPYIAALHEGIMTLQKSFKGADGTEYETVTRDFALAEASRRSLYAMEEQ
ncbi:hypothetical protein H1R20_g6777, partial [Candolleomyces eurysporus]